MNMYILKTMDTQHIRVVISEGKGIKLKLEVHGLCNVMFKNGKFMYHLDN